MHAISNLSIWVFIGFYINSAESLEKYQWEIDIRINWKYIGSVEGSFAAFCIHFFKTL